MISPGNPVAIVGIAAELPSGIHDSGNFDHRSFFDFLLDKGESYEPIPLERINANALHGRALGQVLPRQGSFLKDLDLFDHVEFGITARDAQHMTVANRKLLELSFLALLDSGIDYRGRDVGCYMAGSVHDWYMLSGQDEYEARGSFAGSPAMVANRISYHLDLRGPSVPTDTACSSSLTAMHLALQAIRAGECESAVVGGCQINLRFVEWFTYTHGGIVNSDGKCKPFDVNANGFGRAEGGVTVVLKPLADALRDGDHIYGSILGTGINSTGSQAPVSAPVAASQEAAMRKAFKQAGRLPQEVDFLELHATGTATGDPTEANWVGRCFKRDGDREILLGSLKGNVGHLEISAFLASLSKVCSIFETGLIPPNVNLTSPNPAIKWDEYRLRVPTEVTPLPRRDGRALVAMTSSGIGGANGHCVVESPPGPSARPAVPEFWASALHSKPRLFLCGGLSPRTASTVAEDVELQRHAGVDSDALSLTSGRRARSMPWLSYSIASSEDTARFTNPVLVPKSRGPLAFVFSGQGPQHIGMGRELFRCCVPFRKSILELDVIHERATGESLVRKYGLFDDGVTPESILGDIWPIHVTLPALTMVQVALVDAFQAIGIQPDVVVGHSAGETAVLYASGAATKEQTLELSIARGRGMSFLESLGGSMAAINCSPADAERIIAQVVAELGPGSLEVGCYNDTDALTFSGLVTHLDRAVDIALEKGIFARKLKTRVAVHSSLMEGCREEYNQAVSDVFAKHAFGRPRTIVYSSATGDIMQEAASADYFWTNSRGPVRFDDAIRAIVQADERTCFLELGPHPVLSAYLSSLAPSAVVSCPLRRPNSKKPEKDVEIKAFLSSIAHLATTGHHADFAVLAGAGVRPLAVMPAYPFSRKSVPVMAPSNDMKRLTRPRNGPLNFPELHVNTQTHPSLADHLIQSEALMPAAGYMEMAFEFGARRLWNVKFLSMLGLTSSRPTPVQVRCEDGHWTVSSSSHPAETVEDNVDFDRLHAEGYMSKDVSEHDSSPNSIDIEQIRSRCTPFGVDQLYADIAHFANYGPHYRRITAVSFGDEEALVELRGFTSDIHQDPAYVLHPAILDAALHTGIHPMMTNNRNAHIFYLPASVQSVTIHDALLRGMPEVVFSHITKRKWTPRFITFDYVIADASGTPLCTMEGFGIAQHGAHLVQPSQRYDLVHVPLMDISVASCGPSVPRSLTDVDDNVSPTLDPELQRRHVFPYQRGEELLLQDVFAKLDVMDPHTLWFTASTDARDGGASGFTRSLRVEYKGWTVRLVSFDPSWTDNERQVALKKLFEMEDVLEDEVIVDIHGRVLVPRLTATDGPSEGSPFDPAVTWELQHERLVHVDKPMVAVDEESIVLDVITVSEGAGGLREFIGRDAASSRLLMGITNSSLSNTVAVAQEACVEVAVDAPKERLPSLIAVAVAALGLGHAVFTQPTRMRKAGPVIVTHAESSLGRALVQILTALNIRHTPLATISDLSRLAPSHASVILSGYSDAASNKSLAVALKTNGRMLVWSDAANGVSRYLRQEPWVIGDAFRHAMATGLLGEVDGVPATPPLALVREPPAPGQLVSSSRSLFDETKAYLLIGGIGSIGVNVAHWLYENGARHIILTSRTGGSSLRARGDVKSQRMLAYLQSLPDLDLRLAGIGATSVEDMSALLVTISCPIGGCMFLSGFLRDRPFAGQDADTFHSVFEPKVGAFQTVQQVMDLGALDWVIAFTSISGFFGNAGQTSYAAANTALDALIRSLPNAFSLVTPLISDSSISAETDAALLRHISSWSFTAAQLCACIADGLRMMRQGRRFWLYVPDYDWAEVGKHTAPAPAFQHLVGAAAAGGMADDSPAHSVEDVVLRHLDVVREDLNTAVPLTAYGLDSLSASRLSFALRHFVAVTQMQLLADMSVNDIYRRAEAAALTQKTGEGDSGSRLSSGLAEGHDRI